MKSNLLILLLIVGTAFGQVSLPGLFANYDVGQVASAGGAGIVYELDGGKTNAANIIDIVPQVGLSIIRYPANIYAQSANYANRFNAARYNIYLRRINYGTFDKIDADGNEDGYYSAGDTWINANFAHRRKVLTYGFGGGLFLSNLDSYNAAALVLSAGTIYHLDNADLRLGLSIANIGFYLNRFTDHKNSLPTQITFSAGKGLKYLPLELNTDISYRTYSKEIYFRLGGVFQLPYNFNIIFGVNSDNLAQATEYNNIKSLFGGTGLGLSYGGSQYQLAFGGYSYGTGGWTYGTTFSYLL